MKYLYIILLVSISLLPSCFEDEGNYEYDHIDEPAFDFENIAGFVVINGKLNGNLKQNAQFNYPQENAEQLIADSEYEWIIDDVVISTEKDLNVKTIDVMNLLNLDRIPVEYIHGLFKIINKQTGVVFTQKLAYKITSDFVAHDWLILSEHDGNSRLSALTAQYGGFFGVITDSTYNPIVGVYSKLNHGDLIPGKPVKLIDYHAKGISENLGATTVLTSQVAWDINNETMMKAADVHDEFLNGAPDNLQIRDLYYDNDKNSYILSEDGNVYIRKFSSNYLGGKYINTPYKIDSKDFFIESFSEYFIDNSSFFSLIYDSENRKMRVINKNGAIESMQVDGKDFLLDLTNIPKDINILYYTKKSSTDNVLGVNKGIVIYEQGGVNYAYEFETTESFMVSAVTYKDKNQKKYELPFSIDSGSNIWIPTYPNQYSPHNEKIFYTKGNQIRSYDRVSGLDELRYECDDVITAVRFDVQENNSWYIFPYTYMAVGLANGDVMVLSTSSMDDNFVITEKSTFELIEGSKFNVGGKVVDISSIGNKNSR